MKVRSIVGVRGRFGGQPHRDWRPKGFETAITPTGPLSTVMRPSTLPNENALKPPDRLTSIAASPPTGLAELHQRQVAVHMHIQGREQLVFGVGDYGVDPDLGGVLLLRTSSRPNAPELLFVDNHWTGTIRPGKALGCDFLIQLR
jgi:hypothetical protein